MTESEITAEELRRILSYDPETGVFRWRVKTCLKVRVGNVAGSLNDSGYILIRCGKRYRAHRLAWLYVYGNWPDKLIDHINGDRKDNRITNLRVVSDTENAINKCRQSNNTSGYTGVHWDRRRKKWSAHIKINKKKKTIGRFDSLQEAIDARRIAVDRIFGEFARTNDLDRGAPSKC